MMLERLFTWIDRLPRWLQPSAIGAVVLAAIVAARALLLMPFVFAQPRLLLVVPEMVVLAAAAGAAGGLAYALIGRRVLAVPWVGRYLAGIVCVGAYLIPLILIVPRVLPGLSPVDRGAFDLHDPVARIVWLGCTVFFGLFVGQIFFEAPARSTGRGRASSDAS